MYLAPVILFVYNRLWHLKKTIEALKKNELSSESELFVFSDGPKNEDDKEKVRKVRKYLKTIKGFKKVTIEEGKKNLGLANSVIAGVTEIINKHGRVIVVEDDLLTSPYFLKFMNEGLNFYGREEKVACIHAYVYPVRAKLPEVFFLKDPGCLGWATWARGWDLFESDGEKLLKRLRGKKLQSEFDYNNSYLFTQMLKDQTDGYVDSWAIRWYASLFLANKLTLYPGRSLVFHNGNDSSGTHGGIPDENQVKLSRKPINIKNIPVKKNSFVFNQYVKYFESIRPPFIIRTIKKIMKSMRRKYNVNPFFKYSLEKLRFLPRYQRGRLRFNKYFLEYVDPLSLYYEYKDIFEKKIYYFSSQKTTPFIIDAGGYIGMSVLYFKSIYPRSHITVFEPDKSIAAVLKKNIQINKLNDVKVINAGLGKENATVNFYTDYADGGSLFNSLDNKTKPNKIKIVKLSEYINQPVDLLKMNIEGAEGDVFEEIEEKLRLVKKIIFEYHSFYNLPQNLGRILNILDKNGFRYVVANAANPQILIPFNLPKRYRYFNLVYAEQT